MPNRSGNNVTTKNLKLNAQWLKNAARTLGMNGISTIADISPNMAGVGQVAASSISTVSSAASNVRRQHRPIQYLLESNKYVKIGKRAIDNALSDLARGKFTNQDRGSSGVGEFGETSTGTYFGDMSDGSSDNGSQQPQNVYNMDTTAIDNVANAVNTQTKYQLETAKANIDTMVAVASSSMTQSQKNADALLEQLGEVNRGVQALVTYQNENMTKYISASIAYYEAAGKALGAGTSSASFTTTRSVLNENGGLNADAYKDRVKKQLKDTFKGTTAGLVLQILDESADEIANNPLEFVSKIAMEKAIPDITKKALKATDKVFGSFMTEMLLQMGDKWEADESTGIAGTIKRFAGKAFGINERRKTSVTRSGKVSTEAAVFDGVTRAAIIDELPKYARESTSYLRAILETIGGDPNSALRGSRILNRETGRYQSMESFATDFADSIDNQVIAAMDKSSFGKEMRAMADQVGKNEDQVTALNKAIDKFFVAAERSSKGSIKVSDLGENGEMRELIRSAGLDPTMEEFIRKTVSKMVEHNAGTVDFNEGRLRARRNRNARIIDISGDTGMLRSSNLFRSGTGDEIDLSSVTAESLLPQKRTSGGITVPGARRGGFSSQVADALYGDAYARLTGGAKPRNMAPGSVGARLKNIEDILLRGINVRVDHNAPWSGAEGIGSGIYGPSPAQSQQSAESDQSSAQPSSNENEIDLSSIDEIADANMGEAPVQGTGRGSGVAKSLQHARNAMYLMMSGNTSLAMNEMSTMLGETMGNVASAANKHILEPLKNAILPTTETTDENGNTTQRRATVLEMVKEKFFNVTDAMKHSLLGTDEDGNVKTISTVFKEGLAEWRTTFFGDKDPEEIKKEIQARVPDAVGGAVGGGLIGTLVGGPFVGAIIGAGAGFAKRSKWFQDMIFGEVKDGEEVKKGLIPQSVQEYYKANKQDLVGGAAVGGLMGMVVGGPVLGAAAGIGATMLKKSNKFNELIFGKEEIDDETGASKKVGGILGLFRDVTKSYWKGTSDDSKGLSAKALVGATGGLLASFFTPIGPVGGAALGLAASIATNGDKFRQFLFGKENDDGTKEAGFFQKLGNNITAQVINPLRDNVLDFFDKSKDKVIDKMLSPMLAALQPLLNFGGRMYEKTLGKIASGVEKAGEMFTGFLKKIGERLWAKTVGRAGRFIKRAAGAGVSLVTGAVGKGFKTAGSLAEHSNRKASKKRFMREEKDNQHGTLISEWTEQYNNDPRLQTVSLEEYLDDMRSRYYYNYGESLKNYFGTSEDRAKAREETDKRIATRKELRKKALLINQLTGGQYSDTGATAKQAALEAYMQTKGYAAGKGIRLRRYGKMSQEDILEALQVKPEESGAIASAQAMVMDQQLDATRDAAGTLGKIYEWLESVGRRVTGADNPERQERRVERREAKNARSAAKKDRKEQARKEAQRRKDDYENALQETAQSSASSYSARRDAKLVQIVNRWKGAEQEILNGLKSKNKTIRNAAREAYTAFFDEDGNRIAGNNLQDLLAIEPKKREAYKAFKDAISSPEARATQVGKIRATRSLRNQIRFLRSQDENDLPHHAHGGLAEEGAAIVGERGPEIVQFPDRARVLSGRSKIDVNVVGMAPDVAELVTAESSAAPAVQDVRIIGQNGLLATYGTSAKLGSKTNNDGKIREQLKDPDSLISYDDIKPDNNDYEGEGGDGKSPSLLEKILGFFEGSGGILSTLGLIAGGSGIASILLGDDFGKTIDGFFEKQLGSKSTLGKFVGAVGQGLGLVGQFGTPIVNGITRGIAGIAKLVPGVPDDMVNGLAETLTIQGSGPSAGLQAIGLGGLYLKAASAAASGITAVATIGKSVVDTGSNLVDLASKAGNALGGNGLSSAITAAGVVASGIALKSYLTGPEYHDNTDAAGNQIVDEGSTMAQRAAGTHFMTQAAVKGASKYAQGAAGRQITKQLADAGISAAVNSAGKVSYKAGNKFASNAAIQAATGSTRSAADKAILNAAMSQADDVASSKGVMGLISKAFGAIKNFLMKQKAFASVANVIGSKIDDILVTLGKKADKVLAKMPNKVANILTKGGTKEGAAVATAGIGYAVMAFGGALSGGLSAANIFGVRESDVDSKMVTIASVIVAMLNAVPGLWILELVDLILAPQTFRRLICQLLYSALGGAEDLEAKQATLSADTDQYNAEFGTSLDVTEYNDMTNKTFFAKVFGKGAVKTDDSGRAMFDDAGQALRTNHGVAGWFSNGEKEYAKDSSGNVIKGADGKAVQAVDASGHKLYKDGEKKWTGYVGDFFKDVGGWFAGKTTYKTDENGQALVDENGNYIVDHKDDNVFKRTARKRLDQINAAKSWVTDKYASTKESLGKAAKWAAGTATFAAGKADEIAESLPGIGAVYKGVKTAVAAVPDTIDKIGKGIKDTGTKIQKGISDITDKATEISSNVKSWAADRFAWAKEKVGAGMDAVSETAKHATAWISDRASDAKDLLDSGISAVRDRLAPVADRLSEAASSAGKALTDGFNIATSKLKGAASWVGDKFSSVGESLKGIGSWLGDKAKGISDWFGETGENVGEWFKERADNVKNLGKKASQIITAPFKDTVNAVKSTQAEYDEYMKKYMSTSGAGGKGGNIIPFYSQKDPRWANSMYDPSNTETMADAGCGPAALSMAVNGAGGMGPSPMDTASRLQALGARDNTGTSWAGMNRGISSYGLKSDQASNPGTDFVDAGINAEKPVILSGTSFDADDPFTSQGHYVVVSGKDRNGNYIVNDPNEKSPVTYSKEQVTRNAAKGWRVGGGKGRRFRVIQGGGRPVESFDASGTSKRESTDSSVAAATEKWIKTVRAVKQAFASLKPGYADKNKSGFNITINVGGRTLPARSDCTGMISAALALYTGAPKEFAYSSYSYTKTTGDCAQMLTSAGFKPSSWPGWENLKEGDILSRDGHAVVFCRNEGGTHLVYNCGSTNAVNNPNPTSNGARGYTTVWRIGQTCSGGISNFDVEGGGVSTYGSSGTDSGSTDNDGDSFLGKVMSWGSDLASKTLGYLTGKMSLDEATDWSSWKSNISSSASSYAANSSESASSADYSNATVASLSGSTDKQKIWNHLRQKIGLDKYASAAAMGCWERESSNNPDRFEGDYLGGAKQYGGAPAVLKSNQSLNDYTQSVLFPAYAKSNLKISKDAYKGTDGNWYPGFGLAQWTGPRGQALMDFSKQKGLDWRSLEAQLNYFDYELKNNKRGTVDTYNGFSSLEDSTWNFMKKYEGNSSQKYYDQRIPAARAYYDMYANNESTTTTGSQINGQLRAEQRDQKLWGKSGAGGGKGGTAVHANDDWKYNTVVHEQGSSKPSSGTISGSSAPINFADHAITQERQQNDRNMDIDAMTDVLKQILRVLTSSDTKLNNLQYLPNLEGLGGKTSNNFNQINIDNGRGQSGNSKDISVEKITSRGYEEAKRIVNG